MEKLHSSIAFFLSIICIINCASVPIVEKSLNVSESGFNLESQSEEIIPISCTCIPTIEKCGGELIKIVESNCTDDYEYCCIRDLKPLDDNRNNTQSPMSPNTNNLTTNLENPTTNHEQSLSLDNSSSTSSTSPRIKIRIPSNADSIPIPSPTDELEEETKEGPKSSKKCICIPRNDCPTEYVDYTFGFHCSYATVHCCRPQLQPEEIQERQCLCVDSDECHYDEHSTNVLEERKDTFCPYNQIKCCGSHIRKKAEKRINVGVVGAGAGNLQESAEESPYNMSLEQDQQQVQVQEFNGKDEEGEGPMQNNGNQATTQPQGLPIQNPSIELKQENPSISNPQQNSGISSPVSEHDLMTHYNFQPPNQIPHVQNTYPPQPQPPAQRPPIREYMGQYWRPGQEPAYRNYVNINAIPHGNSNIRQPITTQIRSFGTPPSSPGILDSISNFFFG